MPLEVAGETAVAADPSNGALNDPTEIGRVVDVKPLLGCQLEENEPC